jgi:hypothetical protein
MSITSDDASKEIVKCMNMDKDGIHAVLMVFCGTSRFSREDASTIETIKVFFGEKIVDHMILVLLKIVFHFLLLALFDQYGHHYHISLICFDAFY